MLVKNIPILKKQLPFPAPLVRIELDFPEQEQIDSGDTPAVYVNVEILLDMVRLGSLETYTDGEDERAGSYEADIFGLLREACNSKESAAVIAEWLDKWAKDIRWTEKIRELEAENKFCQSCLEANPCGGAVTRRDRREYE